MSWKKGLGTKLEMLYEQWNERMKSSKISNLAGVIYVGEKDVNPCTVRVLDSRMRVYVIVRPSDSSHRNFF